MPKKFCVSCKRVHDISSKEWKYISNIDEYICSLACLLPMLRNYQSIIPAVAEAVENPDFRVRPDFKSEYELYFSQWLERNGFRWLYEPFIFPVGNGSYTPDFLIVNHGVFVETKGAWGISQKTKMKKFREQYPSINLVVVSWLLSKEIYDVKKECGCIIR